jgi:uncharacterized membrane protein
MIYSPVLPVHVAGGMAGIVAGAAALVFRKGGARHAFAGRIFVVAMMVMAVGAVYLAIIKNQPNNVGGGFLTFYLLGTAWLTAKRADGRTHRYDWALMLIPISIAILSWMAGVEKVRAGVPPKDGVPAGMHFFMGSVLFLAAIGDARMLLGGGVAGAKRIVRHLWRMCFGLFIATGSFFFGQQQVFPKALRGSALLAILGVLPLPILIFWLLRFRFADAYKNWRRVGASAN